MFGMLPASGLYVRHVRGLRLNDVSFRAAAGGARSTVVFDDVIGARVSGLSSRPVSGDKPVVHLIQTSDVWISESAAPAGTSKVVGVDGAESNNILLSANDLRGATKAFQMAGDVSPKAVTLGGNISIEMA
jgi:hypothetical protein